MDHHFAARFLIDKLHYLKICESYSELQNYKITIIKHSLQDDRVLSPPPERIVPLIDSDDEDDLENCLQGFIEIDAENPESDADEVSSVSDEAISESDDTESNVREAEHDSSDIITEDNMPSYLDSMTSSNFTGTGEQEIIDNLDLEQASTSGYKGIHILGRIVTSPASNMENTDKSLPRKRISPGEKSSILSNTSTVLVPYTPQKSNGLTTIKFMPFTELSAMFQLKNSGMSSGDVSWL